MITSYRILPELWHMYAGHYWDSERQGSAEVLGDKSARFTLPANTVTFVVLGLKSDLRDENQDLCGL